MARGSQPAQDASKAGLQSSQQYNTNAQGLYSTVAPALQQDIVHPTGMTPEEKSATNTAAQQSAGGSQAAAVGQGSLLASRTRNAGTADAAIQSAARGGGEQLSDAALKTELADTELKQHKRAAALGEAGGLYGTSAGAGVGNLNATAANVNANTNAASQSWDWAKYLLDPALSAGSASKRF